MKLGEVVLEAKDGGTPPRNNPNNFGGDINWCVVKDIQKEIFQSKEKLTQEGINNSSAKVWPVGTIIISLGATIGEVGIARVPTATKQGLAGIVVDETKVIPEFLAYVLRNKKRIIQHMARGGTIKEVRPSRLLKELDIEIPSIDEQKRIISILDKANEIKNVSNQTITVRNEAILSYFEELISHCDDFVNLSEIAELINGDRGKNYPSGTDIVEEGIRFINAGHIVDFSLTKDKEKMNYITSERFELLRGRKIQRNDLLYCLRGSLGKCALIEDDELGSIASSLVIIRPDTDVVNPIFLVWYLRSQYGVRQILRFDNGTAQPNLSAKSVKSYSIPNLPLTKQNEFARFVKKICGMGSVTKLTDTLVNSTMQEMLT